MSIYIENEIKVQCVFTLLMNNNYILFQTVTDF